MLDIHIKKYLKILINIICKPLFAVPKKFGPALQQAQDQPFKEPSIPTQFSHLPIVTFSETVLLSIPHLKQGALLGHRENSIFKLAQCSFLVSIPESVIASPFLFPPSSSWAFCCGQGSISYSRFGSWSFCFSSPVQSVELL